MLAFFCTLFRKEVFQKVGYLDEDFGIGYGDDDDFCQRMRQHKMKCAVAYGAYVYHDHQSTFSSMYSKDEIEKMKKSKLALFKQKHNEEARVK
jgi:GT2 family glycosyltransferase